MWLGLTIGLIFGGLVGVVLTFHYLVKPLTECIKSLGAIDEELEFDSLPVEPIQINNNTIYTVMGGSERIH